MGRLSIANLCKPFSPQDIEWRVGNVSKSGKMCTLLPYITSRAVMDRLDSVVLPENWTDCYVSSPVGNGLECQLSIRIGKDWITKIDAAEPTNIESVKGAYSDSLKRAAVKWGIGRYLYRLPLSWVKIKSKQQQKEGDIFVSSKGVIGYATPPALPDWALPLTMRTPAAEQKPQKKTKQKPQKKPEQVPEQAPEQVSTLEANSPHDEEWEADRPWFCANMDEYGGYAKVKEWALLKNWGKPSTWGNERRKSFIVLLEKKELQVGT